MSRFQGLVVETHPAHLDAGRVPVAGPIVGHGRVAADGRPFVAWAPDYDRYEAAIRAGRVRLYLERACIQVDAREAWEKYGIPEGEAYGARVPLPRMLAIEVVREMVRAAGLAGDLSGTFDWGYVPDDTEPFAASDLVEFVRQRGEDMPRRLAERASEILSAGQIAADSI